MDLSSVEEGMPAFLTLVLVPLTQSISCGIGVGFITFVALRLVSGRGREVSPWLYGISLLFVGSFIWGGLTYPDARGDSTGTQAAVSIGGGVKAAIGVGLVVLVGVEEADTSEDIEWLSGKIVRLRVFGDEEGLMNRSVQEVHGEILVISSLPCLPARRRGIDPHTAGRPVRRWRSRSTTALSGGWSRTSESQ